MPKTDKTDDKTAKPKPDAAASRPQRKSRPPESAENFEHALRRLVIERDGLRKG